jgi:hypothetical protein
MTAGDRPELAQLRDIDELLAMHPDRHRSSFEAGRYVDATSFGTKLVEGKLLSFVFMAKAYRVSRPLFKIAAKTVFPPWQGMIFDADGERGTNKFMGLKFLRFRCDQGPSVVDGEPCLRLHYGDMGNLWPTKGVFDEVRLVSDHVALGCTVRSGAPTLWYGLQL